MSEQFRGVTLERYAEILAQLALAGEDRERLLRQYELSETDWEELDEHYQQALELAENNTSEDEVPELVARFSQAFARGAAARNEPELSFEEYANVVHSVQRGAELHRLLEQRRVSTASYLNAHAHYLKRMLDEPELQKRFTELMTGRSSDQD